MKTDEMQNHIQLGKGIVHVVTGLLMIILGILIINRLDMMWIAIYAISLLLLSVLSLFTLLQAFKERNIAKGIRFIGIAIFGVILAFNHNYVIGIVTIIFGIWATFNAGVHALELFLKIQDGELGKLKKVFAILFDGIIGILLLTQGFQNRLIINIQTGTYIIVYGVIQIASGLKYFSGSRVNVKLSAPIMYSALLPPFVVNGLRKAQKDAPEDFKKEIKKTIGNKISVYIHIKDYGLNRLGHIDLGYNGSIYSYGNYDEDNRSKNSIYGDGVLICGSEVDFINFSVKHKTIVYQYVIDLSLEEARMIDNQINHLLKDTYYFKNPGVKGAHLTNLQEQSNFYSFYKFNNQPYKTYNMFTTNCVMLANAILESSGLKLFQLSGIITPGSYYSYLEELVATQSVPIERIIHTY